MGDRGVRRWRGGAALVVAALAFAAGACSGGGGSGDGTPGFEPRSPGSVLTRMDLDVSGVASATRVVYSSRGVGDRASVVSGTLLEPEAPWTGDGPRPVLVIAPGTQGAADNCAPSMTMHFGREIPPPARDFLAQGWAVAITDYEGLGTPGQHTYLVREPQGKATLDVARAAIAEWGAAPVALFGFSQGGAATAAAAELASDYAPELDIRAVYAGGVPEDLRGTAAHIDRSPLAGAMGYAINGLLASYPDIAGEVRDVLSDEGLRFVAETATECVGATVANWGGRDSRDFTRDGRTLAEHLGDPGMLAEVVGKQKLGGTAPAAPMFVSHNEFDGVIPVQGARDLVGRWCAAGADVTYAEVSEDLGDASHGLAWQLTRDEALRWLAGILDGTHERGC